MRPNNAGRSPRRRRRRAGVLALLILVVLIGAAWVGWRALQARDELAATRTIIRSTETGLLSAQPESARASLAALQVRTRRARELTHDPVWSAYRRIPVLGRSLTTVAGLTAAADDLALEALPELVEVGATLSPSSLRVRGDTIALAPLVGAQQPLDRAASTTTALADRIHALPSDLVVGPVAKARAELLGELVGLSRRTRSAAAASRVAPSMLGSEGPRRYLLAIQNNAEARATGGLIGAFGIVEADRGRVRLAKIGLNSELVNATSPVVDLGPEYTERYRGFAAESFWLNANMSPHFPYAHAIWTELYRRATGVALDGTIAVDPVAMSYLLSATGGAVLPDGRTVDGANVVDLTLRDAYARYPDSAQRDAFLRVVAQLSFDRLVSGEGDTKALMAGLGRAAGEGHLLLASSVDAEQDILAGLPVGGVLPDDDAPFLSVITQNAGGNKLDYYLRRSVTYHRRTPEEVAVRVGLRNTAPPGLPAYVRGRLDLPGGRSPVDGQSRTYVSVYATSGARLLRARLNGVPLLMEVDSERGHPVFSAYVDLDPGVEQVLELDLMDPDTGRRVHIGRQSLAVEDEIRVS